MESPSNRTLHLLSLLQAGGDWGIDALADELGASPRTIRRDARRLRDLGYHVESRPGPGAAYRLRPGTRIPPLLLDADEVTTIITGLLVLETWMPDEPSTSVARAKLEQTLPPALRRRAAATALSTQILRHDPIPVDWTLVGTLADAVARNGRVSFIYTDQHGHKTQRVVEPYRHFLRQGHWYVVAHDVDRQDWRLFRLDRMHSATLLSGTFSTPGFPFPSIESWLTSDFGRIENTSES